jgi:hypothetical protein
MKAGKLLNDPDKTVDYSGKADFFLNPQFERRCSRTGGDTQKLTPRAQSGFQLRKEEGGFHVEKSAGFDLFDLADRPVALPGMRVR